MANEMSKDEKRAILFGKTEDQVLSRISQWNNDTACIPIVVPIRKEKEVA